MKITRLILENFANIYTAMNKKKIDIDFSKCKNNITIITGYNGSGKTSILSELHPFANSGSFDTRSEINLILNGCDGYKEIHIEDNEDYYIIKHYYKYKNKSKLLKSFIELNGEELNENGNVTSFKELVKLYLGLEQDLMKITRLGSNVNGLIDLKASNRKSFASNLFSDIDIYSGFYKKVSDRYRILRGMIKSVADKIDKLKIYDINSLEDENNQKKEILKSYEDTSSKLYGKLAVVDDKIQNIDKEYDINSINDLIIEIKNIEENIKSENKKIKSIKMPIVISYPIDDIIKELDKEINCLDKEIGVIKIKNDYDLSILNTLMSDKNELEEKLSNHYSSNRINDLCDLLDSLKDKMASYDDIKEIKETKDDYMFLLSTLQNLDTLILNMRDYSDKAVKEVIKLLLDGKSVKEFTDRMIRTIDREIDDYKVDIANLSNTNTLLPTIIYQLCDENECPYKHFYNKMMSKPSDNMTVLMHKVDSLENKREYYSSFYDIHSNLLSIHKFININKKYLSLLPYLNFEVILKAIVSKKPYYSEDYITNKVAEIDEYNEYLQTKKNLEDVEKELKLVSENSLDVNESNKKLFDLNKKICDMKEENEKNITKLDKYNNKLLYLKEVKNSVEVISKSLDIINDLKIEKNDIINTINKIKQIKIEKDSIEENRQLIISEINKCKFQINTINKEIENNNFKLRDYKSYIKEKEKLEIEFEDVEILKKALSPNTGLPLLFLQIYLNQCIMTINDLLSLVYDDLEINNFIINDKEFRIPYTKKGLTIPDITYASQGERSFLSLALSLALIIQTLDRYNIMLLDEVDATLDTTNRSHFISILEKLLMKTGAEQLFLITHNNMFDNYPVDVIMTSDVNIDNFKNVNVIWKN